MTDQYQAFAKSPIGKFVIKNLGLPAPTFLERFESATPVVKGAVILGAAPSSTLSGAIAQVLANIHANSYAGQNTELQQAAAKAGLNLGAFNEGDKESAFKVAIFDASGIQSSEQLIELYKFFNPIARQIQASGRVIVVGITPETAKTLKQAVAQRALEGFVKSVGKEFKKGIAAQLVYVDDGAADNIESTLRFLASPRSAYVSGQVIRVSKAEVLDVDWAKPLAGKTAVVTGASRGIGEAIAHVLARDGAHVICLDVPQQQADLDRVAAEIGGSTLAIDITAADAGQKIKEAAAAQGGLDVIVHNAGITRDKMLANMKPELWDLVININLSAIERVNEYLMNNQGINANGRIVCVSSISGIAGNLGQTNYAASKAGVIGVVKMTAPFLQQGVTINAVAPGFIETEMTKETARRMGVSFEQFIQDRANGTE